MKHQKLVIDMTPSWRGLMPVLVELAYKGDKVANDELQRMAGLLDDLKKLSDAAKKAGKTEFSISCFT